MINFEKTSKKQMFWITVGAYVTYFLLMVFAPVMTVCINYGLFNGKGVDTKTTISGWALVLLIVIAVVGAVALKKAIAKIPETKIATARFKYTLQTIGGLVVPCSALYAIHLFETDISKACTTGYWLCLWFILGALFDGIILSGIDRENRFREAAAFDKEKAKRVDKV